MFDSMDFRTEAEKMMDWSKRLNRIAAEAFEYQALKTAIESATTKMPEGSKHLMEINIKVRKGIFMSLNHALQNAEFNVKALTDEEFAKSNAEYKANAQ